MIGKILQELRKNQKLSISDLASQLDLKPRTYQSYESEEREPNITIINKLADFYGVSTDYLLGRDAPPPPDIDDILRRCDLSKTEQRFISLYVRIDRKHRAKLVEALEQAAVGAGVPVAAPADKQLPSDTDISECKTENIPQPLKPFA